MRARVQLYVASIVTAAILLAGFVYWRSTLPLASSVVANVAILSLLGAVGEMLAFVLPRGAALGSIGFIPFFALAVLVPSWEALVGIIFIRAAFEISARRELIKACLNVASQTLMVGIAITCYSALGGVSLLQAAQTMTLTQLSTRFGIAALLAFPLGLFANNTIIFAAIAIATGRPVRTVIFDNSRSSVMLDIITAPLIFVFAWVYAAFGPIAAAALWVPILGLRQVHQINLELERTNEELLELMVKSIEARDPYTSGHSRRVHHYSVIIARAIGLPERQINEVGHAALLHDVGKIYEKYAPVISKQDKLTPDEWAIIKDHPVDGANLVATMTRMRDLIPAIRGHHENWDGTGYPDGLAGGLIPLGARIIRFADTIDAMTTERPYRKPLSEGQVRSEIVRCRGTQFDPEIADRLLSSTLWTTLFVPAPKQTPALTVVAASTRSERKLFKVSVGA